MPKLMKKKKNFKNRWGNSSPMISIKTIYLKIQIQKKLRNSSILRNLLLEEMQMITTWAAMARKLL